MKKIVIIGIIMLLFGIVIYANKSAVYNTGRNVLRSMNEKKVNSQKEDSDFVWGIDLSHHQRRIDWDLLVAENKPEFIFLKCSEGKTHQDTRFKEYREEARKREILTGAYHFFSYQSSGKEQAENFIKNADLKKGDLYPVLDIEYKKNRPSNSVIRKEVKEFCKVIKAKYGVNPIIYCEDDYYTNILKQDFEGYNYWISNLYREPRTDYVFWQYTERGEVKGIGKIDNNRMKQGLRIGDFVLSDFD